MSQNFTINYDPAPQPDDVTFIRNGLSAYNKLHAMEDTFEPHTWFVRDREGKLVGGLLAGFIWNWLYIDILWLSEELRDQGFGTRLLAEAEQMAIQRGCTGVDLITMSFQAREFYERHGYTVYGALDNFPPGHTKYHLKKLFE